MHKLKSIFFSELTLLSNNLVLMSYLSGIYLESRFLRLWGGVQKTPKNRRKQTEEKHWKVTRKKNEEYEENQITTIYIFGFKLYFARKHIDKKKAVCTIQFYLQFLRVAGYLKHSNDTPNLNIDEYTNYNIIEMYINRLSTATQIFIAMNYLIVMSEKYPYFRKRKKKLTGTFLPTP